uniref:Uncharacterized protein n=1 Tax=Ceratitis capitata TaxID=7213 RepID=W8C973_CERCA
MGVFVRVQTGRQPNRVVVSFSFLFFCGVTLAFRRHHAARFHAASRFQDILLFLSLHFHKKKSIEEIKQFGMKIKVSNNKETTKNIVNHNFRPTQVLQKQKTKQMKAMQHDQYRQ